MFLKLLKTLKFSRPTDDMAKTDTGYKSVILDDGLINADVEIRVENDNDFHLPTSRLKIRQSDHLNVIFMNASILFNQTKLLVVLF